MSKVDFLEPSHLMPMLMPTIMLNRYIQLTEEQVNVFRAWRKKNDTHMVHVMNEIMRRWFNFALNRYRPTYRMNIYLHPSPKYKTYSASYQHKTVLQGTHHDDFHG